jgi:hypothetical protein
VALVELVSEIVSLHLHRLLDRVTPLEPPCPQGRKALPGCHFKQLLQVRFLQFLGRTKSLL